MDRLIYISACCLVLSLTACGDDHEDEPAVVKDGSRLSATMPTQPSAQWFAGDEVDVLNLASIKPNRYVADATSVGTTALLPLQEGSAQLVTGDDDLYAYTPNVHIKGIWASNDNRAFLAQRIPHAYEAAEVGILGTHVPRPVSLWSSVTFNKDGLMSAQLQHLTALLNIPSSTIPEGVRALLLVTHSTFKLNDEILKGGQGESLSGLYQTVLAGSAVLAPDEDEVTCDTLRINLDPKKNYDSYCIPIIEGTYSSLHVLALTGDRFSTYDWIGKELLHFNNKTFTAGVVY